MRIKIYVRLLAACLIFLLCGLFYIQVIKYDFYKLISEENRLRVIPLMAPRGGIFDRNEMPLAKDILSFNVSIVYSQIKDKEALVEMLSDILDIEPAGIAEKINKFRYRAYSQQTIFLDIGTRAAIQLEEVISDYPGLYVEVVTRREYMNGEIAGSILGYLGLINRSEFDKLKHYGYRINDLMGRSGIEKEYDNYLRGTYGGKQIEVDHLGREIDVLGYKEPIPGKDVVLSIDYDLQKFCYDLMEGRQGAIVAMNPRNGAILAMVSKPSFDPEIFIDRKRRAEIGSILNDKNAPMMNRAIRGAYPPGSVFKPVVAAAGLNEHKISVDTSTVCEGGITLGKIEFDCWKKTGHGSQNVVEAIKNSCNVFFYRLGILLDVDGISTGAKDFGLGQITGIDIPGERSGLVPTRKWKKKRFKQPWYKGESVNFSIGQGYLLTTPLQIVRMISVFANEGKLVTPFIVDKVGGVPTRKVPPKVLDGYGKDVFTTVREGMRRCVNDRRGTGMKARVDDITVAGKTGTAQTSKKKNHGWFTGFAPFDDPGLAVVVFEEHGGKGGYFPAESAGKIFSEARRLGII